MQWNLYLPYCPQDTAHEQLSSRRPVKTYLLGKGRKKIVENFTMWNGLWMLGVVSGLMVGSMLLYVLGFLHLDGD